MEDVMNLASAKELGAWFRRAREARRPKVTWTMRYNWDGRDYYVRFWKHPLLAHPIVVISEMP